MANTSLTLSFGDVLSSTLFKWHRSSPGAIADQVFKGLTLFKYLNKRVEKIDGGDRIQIPVMMGENPTAGSYSSWDILPKTPLN